MRKMVLVTPDASEEILLRYLDSEIVGLDEGISKARAAGVRISLAISSFRTVSLEALLAFLPKEKIMKYQEEETRELSYAKVIDFLFSQGAEEIVILDRLAGSLAHIHELLLLLKNARGSVSVHDESGFVAYYGQGVHVITRQGHMGFSLLGFPEAVISLEHVSKPIRNMRLSFSDSHVLNSNILERIAVLKVHSGGVLLALTDND